MDRPKLFINGVEFPVISIAASFAIGGSITISASFPPSTALANILPGSDVVIVLVSDEDESKTRVFTEGRIVGINHSESVGSMSTQLQIVSPYDSISSTLLCFLTAILTNGEVSNILGTYLLPFFGTMPPADKGANTAPLSLNFLVIDTLSDNDGNKKSLVNIGKSFKNALKSSMSGNAYLKRFNSSYNLPDRFFALTDDMHLPEGGYTNLVKYVLNNQITGGSPDMTVASFVEFFVNLLAVMIVPVPIMPELSSTGAPHQYLIMPDIYTIVPPETNVVYPHEVMNIAYSRSFSSQVTREIATFSNPSGNSSDGSNNTQTRIATQPESLKSAYSLNGKTITPKFLPEEDFIGLHGKQTQLSFMLNNGNSVDTINKIEDTSKSYFGFNFNKDVLSASSLVVTVPFKPEILLGFPMYVLTARGSFIGVVSSVTHTYDYSGSAVTEISLSYARASTGTDWLQYKNTIAQIGSNYYPGQTDPASLYKKLFGISSVLSLDKSIKNSSHFSIISSIRNAYEKWIKDATLPELAVALHTQKRRGITWDDYKSARISHSANFGVSWGDKGYASALKTLVQMLAGSYSAWNDEVNAAKMIKGKKAYLELYTNKNRSFFPKDASAKEAFSRLS